MFEGVDLAGHDIGAILKDVLIKALAQTAAHLLSNQINCAGADLLQAKEALHGQQYGSPIAAMADTRPIGRKQLPFLLGVSSGEKKRFASAGVMPATSISFWT